jgi:hypothetical protein
MDAAITCLRFEMPEAIRRANWTSEQNEHQPQLMIGEANIRSRQYRSFSGEQCGAYETDG